MAQACDRIVSNLRKSGIVIDIAHFGAHTSIKAIQQQNGRLFNIPCSEGPGHAVNCFWNLIQAPQYKDNYAQIVAFGGYIPVLALPILSDWLGARAVTLLRGNDFDLGIFSPNRRNILVDAFDASCAIGVLTRDQKKKISCMVDEDKLYLIANGIDVSEWQADKSDIEQAASWKKQNVEKNRIVVGIIGQLKPKKGAMFFLNNVLSANLEDKFHFLLIGDMTDEMMNWLKEKEDRISYTHLEFLDRWELLSWYPACDYVALPSFYDGMPNVLLEAGALGIPVIAAAAGGIPDVVADCCSGLIFHPGDRHSCRESLWYATKLSADERKKCGEILKKRIFENFNSKIENEAYLKLFEKVASTGKIGFMK
ncbi:MAG: hypothetical protein Kow0029_11800 [Candidatus Rifleibacteriota bacterium]